MGWTYYPGSSSGPDATTKCPPKGEERAREPESATGSVEVTIPLGLGHKSRNIRTLWKEEKLAPVSPRTARRNFVLCPSTFSVIFRLLTSGTV